jgi:hypothetical protein
VIAVQVRHDHHIDVSGSYAMGFEIVQEFAPGRLRGIHRFGAEAGVLKRT